MNTTVDRLRLVDIGKSFGAVRALDGVDMAVQRGTVHGLLGENGAGKSTLLRILSGILSPTSGHVEIDGQRVVGHGPVAARRAGIAMIHQELQHVPELTVAQNMFLGRPLKTAGGLLVARREQEQASAAALAPLDPTIDPAAPIKTLKVAQRQIVEIARAMMEDAKVLAMDEPTSSLTPAEFERLAVLIAELAAQGVSIIYVSHKMDEVFRVCETATILRDGRKVTDVVMKDTTESAVVARMVGRELANRRAQGLRHGRDRARGCRPDARHGRARGELQAAQGRGAGHLGPGRCRTDGTPAPDCRRRPARGGRDPRRGPQPRPRQPARRDRRRSRPAARGAQARGHHRPPLGAQQHRPGFHAPLLTARLRAPAGTRGREREADARARISGRSRSSGRSGSSRAATSKRPSSAAGSPPVRASCSSTSRPAASMSAPRPRSMP